MGTKGRPGKLEQIRLEKKLWPYFERGVSASYAATSARLNIKTVCKYFDKWMVQIREADKKDFAILQRKARERIIFNYDDMIFQEYDFLDDVKDEIKRYKEKKSQIPKHLTSLYQDIIKTLASLTEK